MESTLKFTSNGEVSDLLGSMLMNAGGASAQSSKEQVIRNILQHTEKVQEISLSLKSRQQCVVLGMHRSGTSALSGILNQMGLYVGEEADLLRPAEDNIKGYYERFDVVKLNAMLLSAVHATWSDGLHLVTTESLQGHKDVLDDFRRRASRVIHIMEETGKSWQVKDPRMCLTFSLWRQLVPDPIVILAYRNPLEVAASLCKRNNFTLEYGLAMWEKYTLSAIKQSLGLPRVLVSYHNMIEDPVGTTESIFNQLVQFGMKNVTMPTKEKITEFVDPNLNHVRGEKKNSSCQPSPTQQRLWFALEDQSILSWKDDDLLSQPQESIDILKNNNTASR